jgi:hypothetical protein
LTLFKREARFSASPKWTIFTGYFWLILVRTPDWLEILVHVGGGD